MKESTFKTIFILYAVLAFALTAGLVIVAVHFISKYW